MIRLALRRHALPKMGLPIPSDPRLKGRPVGAMNFVVPFIRTTQRVDRAPGCGIGDRHAQLAPFDVTRDGVDIDLAACFSGVLLGDLPCAIAGCEEHLVSILCEGGLNTLPCWCVFMALLAKRSLHLMGSTAKAGMPLTGRLTHGSPPCRKEAFRVKR